MHPDKRALNQRRTGAQAFLYLGVFVIAVQKLYPLIIQHGEFRGTSFTEAIAWVLSVPSILIVAPFVALVFLVNMRQLRQLRVFGLVLVALICAVVFSELVYPYDLVQRSTFSAIGVTMERVMLGGLLLFAVLSPRLLVRWLV